MRCYNLIAFYIVFGAFTMSKSAWAIDYDDAIGSVDSFLTRQLDRFPLPGDYPPEFASATLIQTYDVEQSDPTFGILYHRADVSDSALAAIYFTQRSDIEKARNLLDGIRFVQEEDPFDDGRIRKSYWANDLYNPDNTGPSIDDSNAPVGDATFASQPLTTDIPEPASVALIFLGGLVVIIFSRIIGRGMEESHPHIPPYHNNLVR